MSKDKESNENKDSATTIIGEDIPSKGINLSTAELLIVLNEFRKTRCEEEKVFQANVERLESSIDREVKEIQKRGWLYVLTIVSALGLIGGFLWWYATPIIRAIVTNQMVSDQVQEALQDFSNEKIDTIVRSSVSELEQQLAECANEIALLRLRLKAEAGDAVAYAALKNASHDSSEAGKLLGDVDDYYAKQLILDKFDFARLKGQLININGIIASFKEFIDSASEVIGQFDRVDLSEEEIVSRIESATTISAETVNLIKNLAVAWPNGKRHVGLFVKAANMTDNLAFRIAIVDCIRKHMSTCPGTVDIDLLNAWWDGIEASSHEE